ncbi:hypothetical protein MSHOH_0433 [Methanosarcina horonobensis HB-1 = JCM 15518]|uniref:Uncharacterized protein n=1 Tax=Methanosarcina horonobensis HB-1 = JCM 15518 TaxID=1434110 RepID=A0A0E3S8H3_9EURY|nr:hypothetical protein MSHOH_0433 [Methanosarcina horonobensis HB-1 = JCM 15518]
MIDSVMSFTFTCNFSSFADLFFVHVFDFFDIQLYGLFDLFVDIVTLMGLRYMIDQEERTGSVPELL